MWRLFLVKEKAGRDGPALEGESALALAGDCGTRAKTGLCEWAVIVGIWPVFPV
jgi:hypothetical protein